ncbi:sugar ABC transporter ATP-binding protein [Candidatus Bathyarchaeota archaeon]|nr:MAG: sugar ABC transporter ATP-binding protein [Candidatus Bathyarchaeota archaeon]
MAKVSLKNLTKRFGKVVAVDGVSVEAKDREFLVLLGPSGCGKTTILRCIAGLEIPDEGEVYIGDRLVNDLPPKDRDVAMVFQSYALYPHMTVYDNISFPLRMREIPASEIEERVKKVAELLQIAHLLDRKPKQLSGGEAQRVALGRAIVREPKVFLMDEPLSNLDAKLRIHMRAELKRLHRDLGITTIYVTHDQVEAMTMADKVAVLKDGKLQQVAPPDKLYSSPSNLFVAGFIGSPPMNFIDCSLVLKDEEVFLDAGAFVLKLEGTVAEILREKGATKLVIGIRPEDVSFVNKAHGKILGEVYMKEPLGAETIIDVKVGEYLVKVRERVGFKTKIGDKVWMGFPLDKLHVFDKKTGKAII